MGDLAAKLDKAYEPKTIGELADAAVDALQGVSEHLAIAFGIKTARFLGTNK